MGIENLLKELKKITDDRAHIRDFAGKKCGVDASVWLHRSSYSCALDLVLNKSTKKYLNFTRRCIDLLRHHSVTPIIVFDGAQLPMKANEEQKRGESRKKNKGKALQALKDGNKQEAYRYATMAVRITKAMVSAFINQCIELKVEFVCAPYEADAQLAYMYKQKQIDFVISEDSDLLLFGVEKAFYKFDVNTGSGHFVDLEQLNSYRSPSNANSRQKEMDLCLYLKKSQDRHQDLITCCNLAGSDYIDSLPGIGIKTAVKYCNEYKRIEHLISALLARPQSKDAPKDYKLHFKRAVLAFLHQRVYDTESKALTHLNPLTDEVQKYRDELKRHQRRVENNTNSSNNHEYSRSIYDESLDFLGKDMDANTARLIAEGLLDARSLELRTLSAHTRSTQHNKENENNDNVNRNGNRFFAASSSQSRRKPSASTESSVFQCKQNTSANTTNMQQQSAQRKMWNALRQTEKKPHIASSDEVRLIENANDGLHTKLDDLLTQFGFGGDRNMNPPVQQSKSSNRVADDADDADEYEEWENTEDTFLDFDEKQHQDIFNITIADTEDELNEHKPLKNNRKRKREEMSHCVDTASNYTPSHSKSKRKKNDGSSVATTKSSAAVNQSHRHRNSLRKTPKTPSSSFIQRTIPKNLDSARHDRSPSPGSSLIGDLFSSSRAKLKRKSHQNASSADRKNMESTRKSIAMIGAKNRPIDIVKSESDSEEVVIAAAPIKQRHATKPSVTLIDTFYEIVSDREEQEEAEEERTYSQLSQSQSERQMVDVLNQFQILSQSQTEDDRERKAEEERSATDDDDDEIQVLGKKANATAPTRFVPKPFKPPRFINGTVSPEYKQSAKKQTKTKTSQINKSKTKSKSKSTKAKDSKQTTLNAWFLPKS